MALLLHRAAVLILLGLVMLRERVVYVNWHLFFLLFFGGYLRDLLIHLAQSLVVLIQASDLLRQ